MAIDSDIIIIGGGLNGSLMAIVAAKFGFSSIVLDSKENDTSRENHFDGRSYALALSSVRLLKILMFLMIYETTPNRFWTSKF